METISNPSQTPNEDESALKFFSCNIYVKERSLSSLSGRSSGLSGLSSPSSRSLDSPSCSDDEECSALACTDDLIWREIDTEKSDSVKHMFSISTFVPTPNPSRLLASSKLLSLLTIAFVAFVCESTPGLFIPSMYNTILKVAWVEESWIKVMICLFSVCQALGCLCTLLITMHPASLVCAVSVMAVGCGGYMMSFILFRSLFLLTMSYCLIGAASGCMSVLLLCSVSYAGAAPVRFLHVAAVVLPQYASHTLMHVVGNLIYTCFRTNSLECAITPLIQISLCMVSLALLRLKYFKADWDWNYGPSMPVFKASRGLFASSNLPAFILLLMSMLHFMSSGGVENGGVELAKGLHSLQDFNEGILFLCLGVIGMILVAVPYVLLAPHETDFTIHMCEGGLAMSFMGCVVLSVMGVPMNRQFLVGMVLCWSLGHPISYLSMTSLFVRAVDRLRMVGQPYDPVQLWASLLCCGNAVARVLGPWLSSLFLESYVNGFCSLFLRCAISSAVAFGLLIRYRSLLRPCRLLRL